METEKVKKILSEKHNVPAEELEKAEEFAKIHQSSIEEYLISEGIITKDVLGQAIAESYGVPYADYQAREPSRDLIVKIPEETAKKYHMILFAEDKATVMAVSDRPNQPEMMTALKKIFPNKKILTAYAFPENIEVSFQQYSRPLETRFARIIASQTRVAPEIINEITADALEHRASDIHLEPEEKEVIVRFRVDGVLHEVGRIPKSNYINILNRIKVQSHLRVDEHFSAQDGSMRYTDAKGKVVDLRVSIIPTIDGEKVVVRILAEYVSGLTLTDLGLSATNQKKILHTSKKPFGMILVVGPTGCGKSTTLYSLLKTFNRTEVNITTIEDPVEYKIVGANQIQVNPQTNLTFAKGLRSILRQDPDVILVGEIRDAETAEISVNAALTGHLLFSTLHANDASTGIPRLLDMGIEPFLLASTLQLVLAQRLVRRVCNKCSYQVQTKLSDLEKVIPEAKKHFPEKNLVFNRGKGCEACGFKGYRGRIGIFEFIETTPALQALILKNPSNVEIWQLAKKEGAISLFEDGVDKVKRGVTTLEELLRVISPS